MTQLLKKIKQKYHNKLAKRKAMKRYDWCKNRPKLQISEQHRIFFVHIPKTGGTSVDESNFFDYPRGGHADYSYFSEALGNRLHEFKCFTFVRNPWDRLASAFYYIAEGGAYNKTDTAIKENYIDKFNGDFSSFLADFIDNPKEYLQLLHFKPMISFFDPQICQVPFFVQHLETVKSLDKLNQFIGVNLALPHKRKGSKVKEINKVYTEYTFEKVREIYSEDVFSFDYDNYTINDIKN